MRNYDEILAANGRYADAFGDKGALPMPPGRKLAVLACMDARMHPEKFAGFSEGDAHVIRNAGGRASDDAIRSLIISHKLLGTREFYVIHHTDCGMLTFTDADLRKKLREDTGSDAGDRIEFLPFSEVEQSVVDDVRTIREHPLIPNDIPIYGFVYDVKSGRLNEVKPASAIGRASAGMAV